MKSSAFFVALVAGAVTVDASHNHLGRAGAAGRHARLAHRTGQLSASNASLVKRCTRRTPLKSEVQVNNAQAVDSKSPKSSSSSSSPPAKNTQKAESSNQGGPISGLLNVKSDCGDIGATRDILGLSGPNGNIGWLNCGIKDSGWRPPHVEVKDIITVDLDDAMKDPKTPFGPCKDFVPLFEKYGKQFDVPPILMAAFAMQESSCKPDTTGGAGEKGLMQLTEDKCGGAPNNDCQDVDFNIRVGTQFFSDSLKKNGGSLLQTIGAWNGWFVGMTQGQAEDAPCCRCQKNLDYLHQLLNGWCLNIDAYDHQPRLGSFFNLDKCGPTP